MKLKLCFCLYIFTHFYTILSIFIYSSYIFIYLHPVAKLKLCFCLYIFIHRGRVFLRGADTGIIFMGTSPQHSQILPFLPQHNRKMQTSKIYIHFYTCLYILIYFYTLLYIYTLLRNLSSVFVCIFLNVFKYLLCAFLYVLMIF